MGVTRNFAKYAGSHGFVLTTVSLVQFVLVAVNFPLGELLSDKPLFHIDAAHHWYQVKLAVGLAAQGLLVGYDPFFAAGYLGGIPFNTSAKLPSLVAAVFAPWINPALAFKLFSFACAIASPALIPMAAKRLGQDASVCAFAALLALILWWASPVHWYHTAGIVAWPFAVFAASLFAASMIHYVTGQGGKLTVFWLVVGGGFLFLSHPLFPMAVAFALLPLLPPFWRDISWGRLPVLVAVPLACVVLNWPWIMETIRHPGMANGAQPYQQVVDVNMIWQDMLGIPGQGRGSRFYSILVFLALWGMLGGGKPAGKKLSAALFLGGMSTLVFADLGSVIKSVAVIQPNRFGIQAYVLMLVPAALGVGNVWGAMRDAGAKRIAGMASAAFLALGLVFSLNEVRRELTPGPHGHYGMAPPEVAGLGPLSRWAVGQLRQQTDTSARVLFELSHARIHDGGHMAGFLAVQADREFIGGAYPYTHFANAWDNRMFGHPLDDLPPDRFREYLALYNVGWLLLHSNQAKAYVSSLPEIAPVSQDGPLALYRVDREHSFFLAGNGVVKSRGVNQLEFSHLSGETVVLKYHWVPGLRTEPPAKLDGMKMLDDPEPFIRIQNPPESLRLFVR